MFMFRQHGSLEKYVHEIEGHNYRMEEIQAAVLNVKMNYIEKWTEARRGTAAKYTEHLSSFNPVELVTPYHPDYVNPVYHLYIIRCKQRDELMKYLNEKGVQTGLHYPMPLHIQNAYKYRGYKNGDFPAAEKGCSEILSIPIFPEITDEQVNYICDTIKSFYD